ncbi:MAG: CAP domain-containing protein, partial [Lachnospiraceae bacterium]|nr:CAP domain-containing protein [Lachnospiraceae bacterium]
CGDSYTVTTLATGHSYTVTNTVATTCMKDGYIEYTCSACGDGYTVVNGTATGHTEGDWVITKEAEVGVEGEQVKYCTECGAILEKETIEALAEDEYDQTYYIKIADGSMLEVVGHFDEARTNLMLEKINAYREENGKDALPINDALQTYTELRALETSYLWEHTRPNSAGKSTSFGENIAMMGPFAYYDDMDSEEDVEMDVNAILNSWKRSTGHNNNILSTYYDYLSTGLSCFMAKTIDEGYTVYTEYWVQVFSIANDSKTTLAASKITYDFQ